MKKPPMGPPPAGFKPPMADLSGVRRMELDIPYGSESPAQRLDMFWPETGEGPFPTLVYVHGGGFASSPIACAPSAAPRAATSRRGWA